MNIDRAGLMVLMILAGTSACATATEGGAPARPGRPSSDNEALALKTLSEHLSRPAEEIEVVSVAALDWPDSSLGCPKPDRSYLQVIRPGHLAILQHGGQTYRVHMANGKAFVCDSVPGKASAQAGPVPVLTLPLKELQTLARADLAHRLGVAVELVSLTSSRAVVWTDTSLGCPDRGRSYQSVKNKGYVFDLLHRGRAYTYHTDLHRVLPCPPLETQ